MEEIKKIIVIGALSLLALILPRISLAESIYISPSSSSYAHGTTFSVRVLVNTDGSSINAVSGRLSFPTNILNVVSISKDSSIVNLWVKEPSFSNENGVVSFEGITLGGGYSGSDGRAIIVNFKAIGGGKADVKFDSASLLSNDGMGTNILEETKPASFVIGESQQPKHESIILPSTIKINSSSHPDEKKWYSNADANLSWTIPTGATKLYYSVSKISSTVPVTPVSIASSTIALNDLANGVSYFNIKYVMMDGSVRTGSYRLNIDSLKPASFTIRELPSDGLRSISTLLFTATDNVSAIDKYIISIDSGSEIEWRDSGDGIYTTEALMPGIHTISGQAIDLANNGIFSFTHFNVPGFPAPTITDSKTHVSNGEFVMVSGNTIPNTQVHLMFKKSGGNSSKVSEARSDRDGNFSLIWQPKSNGIESSDDVHSAYVYATNSSGLNSFPTADISLTVSDSTFEFITGRIVPIIGIALLVAIILLIIVIIYINILHRIKKTKNVALKRVKDVQSNVHESFDTLRDDIDEAIYSLEKAGKKRELTTEEKSILKKLSLRIRESEKEIESQVISIAKKIKR